MTALKSIVTASLDGVVRILCNVDLSDVVTYLLEQTLEDLKGQEKTLTVIGTSFVPEFRRCRFNTLGRSVRECREG